MKAKRVTKSTSMIPEHIPAEKLDELGKAAKDCPATPEALQKKSEREQRKKDRQQIESN